MSNTFGVAASSSGGVSVGTILTIVFVVLKLTHTIAWSWWWVLSPLLLSAGLTLVATIAAALFFVEIKKSIFD